MNGKPTGGTDTDEAGGRPPFFVLSAERSGTLAVAYRGREVIAERRGSARASSNR